MIKALRTRTKKKKRKWQKSTKALNVPSASDVGESVFRSLTQRNQSIDIDAHTLNALGTISINLFIFLLFCHLLCARQCFYPITRSLSFSHHSFVWQTGKKSNPHLCVFNVCCDTSEKRENKNEMQICDSFETLENKIAKDK